jgi:N-acetylglucosamine kinase-like BadF-type ATPase
VGGWGSLLGDEGSGYALGLEALRQVARGADGRAPAGALEPSVLAHLGLELPDALISWAAGAGKRDVAALAPLLAAAAAAGDPAAAATLAGAVRDLAEHVAALRRRLEPWSEPPRVALTGGLLRPGGPLRSAMEEAVRASGLRLLDREPDPALGAARRARQRAEAARR